MTIESDVERRLNFGGVRAVSSEPRAQEGERTQDSGEAL